MFPSKRMSREERVRVLYRQKNEEFRALMFAAIEKKTENPYVGIKIESSSTTLPVRIYPEPPSGASSPALACALLGEQLPELDKQQARWARYRLVLQRLNGKP